MATRLFHHHFPPELRNQLGAFDLELRSAARDHARRRGGKRRVPAGLRHRHDSDPPAPRTGRCLRAVRRTPGIAAPIADSAIATLLAAIGADPKDRS
ncbi:MAG: hypothetical protein R2710_08060 [Acidimicrobiales bacterium]